MVHFLIALFRLGAPVAIPAALLAIASLPLTKFPLAELLENFPET